MDFLETMARGIGRFRRDVFPRRQEQFESLASVQQPKALFLTCADSRVLPSLITQTGPGELFVERNPGNIAPIYSGEAVGVSASIEYAISALKTPHVIICGHSDCGAVKGILNPEAVADMPAVARWLRYGDEARRRLGPLATDDNDEKERLARLTELNVLVQMEHLATHPAVQQARAAGRLTIHGWVYEIETGEVGAYDPARGSFVPLTEAPSTRTQST